MERERRDREERRGEEIGDRDRDLVFLIVVMFIWHLLSSSGRFGRVWL